MLCLVHIKRKQDTMMGELVNISKGQMHMISCLQIQDVKVLLSRSNKRFS